MYTTEIFDDNDNKELGYDLKDDLMVFMNNDPVFYRKRYFPTMLKFDKYHKAGKRVQPRAFEGLVREAYAIYQNKFPVEGLEKELPDDICEEICVSIHEQETKNCKNKFYEIDESVDAIADVAFCFGRFNPVHKGHAKLWETVQRSGRKWFVGTNPNTHDAKNPLQFEEKATWMQVIHPDLKGHITPETSILTMASTIYETLKKDSATVAYVTDEKDWHWAGPLLEKYNGQYGPHGYYNFAEIKHIESPRITSSTILKEAVKENDEDVFYEAAGVSRDVRVNGKTFFEAVNEAGIFDKQPESGELVIRSIEQAFTHLQHDIPSVSSVYDPHDPKKIGRLRTKWYNEVYVKRVIKELSYIVEYYTRNNKTQWILGLERFLKALPRDADHVEMGANPLPEILKDMVDRIIQRYTKNLNKPAPVYVSDIAPVINKWIELRDAWRKNKNKPLVGTEGQKIDPKTIIDINARESQMVRALKKYIGRKEYLTALDVSMTAEQLNRLMKNYEQHALNVVGYDKLQLLNNLEQILQDNNVDLGFDDMTYVPMPGEGGRQNVDEKADAFASALITALREYFKNKKMSAEGNAVAKNIINNVEKELGALSGNKKLAAARQIEAEINDQYKINLDIKIERPTAQDTTSGAIDDQEEDDSVDTSNITADWAKSRIHEFFRNPQNFEKSKLPTDEVKAHVNWAIGLIGNKSGKELLGILKIIDRAFAALKIKLNLRKGPPQKGSSAPDDALIAAHTRKLRMLDALKKYFETTPQYSKQASWFIDHYTNRLNSINNADALMNAMDDIEAENPAITKMMASAQPKPKVQAVAQPSQSKQSIPAEEIERSLLIKLRKYLNDQNNLKNINMSGADATALFNNVKAEFARVTTDADRLSAIESAKDLISRERINIKDLNVKGL